jgi:hypothetical protein
VKPRVWIDSVPHGERRPRSFIASDLARRTDRERASREALLGTTTNRFQTSIGRRPNPRQDATASAGASWLWTRKIEVAALGTSVGAGTAMSESYDLGEDGTQRRGATITDALLDAPFEPGDLTSRERSEQVSSTREVDARRAGIVEIGPPFHEPGAFDDTNHRRHRLLREV